MISTWPPGRAARVSMTIATAATAGSAWLHLLVLPTASAFVTIASPQLSAYTLPSLATSRATCAFSTGVSDCWVVQRRAGLAAAARGTEARGAVMVPAKRKRFASTGLAMSTVEIDEGGDGMGGGGVVVEGAAAVTDEFDVKTDLLNQIDLASSSKKRTAVNELMLKLEPMNPTQSPARSPILNGVWEFLYTGGLSPGTLAVQVISRVAKTFSAVVDLKGVTLTIKRDQPRVEAAVKLNIFGAQAQVKVRTRLELRSDMRLQEVYEEAEVGGVKIPIPVRIQPRRTLFITYLDEDIMIARDDSGAPDLLIRKEKEFRFNTGTPSTSEDDSAPGSG